MKIRNLKCLIASRPPLICLFCSFESAFHGSVIIIDSEISAANDLIEKLSGGSRLFEKYTTLKNIGNAQQYFERNDRSHTAVLSNPNRDMNENSFWKARIGRHWPHRFFNGTWAFLWFDHITISMVQKELVGPFC
jgi:hypothetical protein